METAKRILTKEKVDRQLAGESTELPPFLSMKEDNEQRHKMVIFNKINVKVAKIDKLTSMLGKLSIHNRQAKQFKPRVCQCRD